MFSDSLFQFVDDMLEAIANYDYIDDFQDELIEIISKMSDIRDELDHPDDTDKLLKYHKDESIKIATKLYQNAVLRRSMSSVDFYEGVYDK